jgi:hypothetical protein
VLKWLRCGSSERILKEEHGPWSVSSDDGGSDVDVTPRACPWDEWTCANAASNGHLAVLQWAREHECPWDEHTCEYAEERGELEVLRWAIEHGCPGGDQYVHHLT